MNEWTQLTLTRRDLITEPVLASPTTDARRTANGSTLVIDSGNRGLEGGEDDELREPLMPGVMDSELSATG